VNASKDKGTKAETAVVRFLQENGHPDAERRALAGTRDRGDIAGMPKLVIEVKAEVRLDLAGWLSEARHEAANAGPGTVPVVWHKRRGRSSPGDWYVTMGGQAFLALLERRTNA